MRQFALFLLVSLLAIATTTLKAQDKKNYEITTVAFYNLENLFDTIIDPDPNKILQDDFTPKGKNMWNTDRYKTKLENMSKVIANIGAERTHTAPMIVGISEVENKAVITDLINTDNLKKYNYGIVHYESPDRRGIDIALIYRKDFVKIKSSASRRLYFPEVDDFRTRDQLVVEADLQGESIYVIVNHWPSRRGGEKRSSPRREAAAKLARSIADSVTAINANAKIIIMGDLNDDPTNTSVKKYINTSADINNVKDGQFYNPMENKYKKGNGTGAYNDVWSLFDQLMLSKPFLNPASDTWTFSTAKIYKKPELIQTYGKYRGYPKRTFAGGSWLGGYSDHFPVYLYLVRETK